MKIRLLSDLHLEFVPFSIPPMEGDSETVLVLAGDVAPIIHRDLLESFLRDAAGRFRHVCFVPGNHEYYDAIWPDALDALHAWSLPANVHVLQRSSVLVDDVVFLGTTLWTDMAGEDPDAMELAQRMLFDYRVISQAGDAAGSGEPVALTPRCTVDEHRRSRQWIESSMRQLSQEGRKVVLITHHGVTLDSVHERFRGNPLNPAFVSDMNALLLAHPPALVVHGHVHNSFSYRVSGVGPRVVVNPRGYMRKDGTQENPEFDPCLVLEV